MKNKVGGGVEALLFDLGGVIIQVDFGRAIAHWAEAAACDPEVIRSRFRFDKHYERHERGEITGAEYFASLRAGLGLDLDDDEIRAGWNAIYVGDMPGAIDQLRRAQGKLPLYAFTNSNATHQQVWEPRFARALSLFDTVFISSAMGLRKPEAAAFHAVSKAVGIPLDRMVFYDDVEENLVGARAVGLQTVHVTSANDICRSLDGIL